jgi:proteasome lid subunit RPN8/RPN11
MKLVLSQKQLEEIVAHALKEMPNEACGLLGGKGNRVEKVYPLPNLEKSPYRYKAEPEAQYRAMVDMEEKGLEIVGIYHSHPSYPAYPSATDLEMAYYPEAIYLIVSLSDPQKPVVKAFSLITGKPEEVEIEVLPNS